MNQAAVVISNFTPMSNPILFQKIPLTREAGLMHAKFQKIDSSVVYRVTALWNGLSSFFYDFRKASNYFANLVKRHIYKNGGVKIGVILRVIRYKKKRKGIYICTFD